MMLAVGFYTEGTKITLEVDRTYEQGDTTYVSLVEKGEAEGNPYDHIPIAIKNENGKIIGYLADVDSIPNRVVGENVDEDISMLRTVREAIVKEGVYESRIEHKSLGHLAFTAGKKPLSVSEAFKDPNLVLGVPGTDGIQYLNGKEPKGTLFTKSDLRAGHLYAFVEKDGESHIAIPLIAQRLNTRPDIVLSIVEAVRMHLHQDQSSQAFEAATKSGYNLSTAKGIEDYIRTFVDTAHLPDGKHLRDIYEDLTSPLDSVIDVSLNGIEIAIGGGELFMSAEADSAGNMVYRSGLGEDRVIIDAEEFYQGLSDVLDLSYMHASLDLTQGGQSPMKAGRIKYPLIDVNRNATVVETDYGKHLKENHTTNIVQFDLGDGHYTVFQLHQELQ
jgi:hypothetical protein